MMLSSCGTKRAISDLAADDGFYLKFDSVANARQFEYSFKGFKQMKWDRHVPHFISELNGAFEISTPEVYKRPSLAGEEFPLFASYFYSLPDSTIRLVLYEWSKYLYRDEQETKVLWLLEKDKRKGYKSKYYQLKQEFQKLFGPPIGEDDELIIQQGSGEENIYMLQTTWEQETFGAELYLIFEEQQYSINLKYYWK